MCGAKEEMTLGDDSCTKTKNPSVFNQGVQVHGDAAEMPPRFHRVLAEIVSHPLCVSGVVAERHERPEGGSGRLSCEYVRTSRD